MGPPWGPWATKALDWLDSDLDTARKSSKAAGKKKLWQLPVARCQVNDVNSMAHEWHMNDTWKRIKTHHFLRHCESSVHCMLRNAVCGSPCWLQGECDTYCNQCSTRPRSRNIHFLALRWHYLREKDITSNYSLVGSPWVNSKHPTNWPRIINSIATCWTTAMSFTPPEARLDARQRSIWSFPYFNIQKMIYRKSQSL